MRNPTAAEPFRAIAEISGDVAWIVDCATLLPTYLSPAVEHMLGYRVDEALAQYHDNAADQPLQPLWAGLSERLYRFAHGDASRLRLLREFDLPHKNGALVPIEVISTLLLDEAGKAVSVAGIIRDLSARREHEAGQHRFASMLNHEFRTPLSTIDGAIQRLEVTGANADSATRERYRKIGNAVDRLIGMLDEYLSPDRLQSINRKPQASAVKPASLLIQAEQAVTGAGLNARVELGDLPATLRCEPQGLKLALKVLVDNAIQYSPTGADIDLTARRADGGVEFVVRDYGGGVPPAEREHIFGKTYRGSNAGVRPGSGLGLYMARAVVEVHGGSVTLVPVTGAGAAFRMWLPVVEKLAKNLAHGGPNSDNS